MDISTRRERPRAAIATGHPATGGAAEEILLAGGNAFDAAAAACLAAAVAEPMLASLGGGGFLLAHTAEGDALVLDFFVNAPRNAAATSAALVPVTVHFSDADQVFWVGGASVGVPGAVAGVCAIHERHGRLPFEAVVAPAVRLARAGVPVNDYQASTFVLLQPILERSPAARALFMPDGHLPRAGERLRNPALAELLDSLPRLGPRALAAGARGRALALACKADGGALEVADLEGYQVVERRPMRVPYRGFTVLTNPAPSFGGALVAAGLGTLEAHQPDEAASPGDEALAVAEAVRAVHEQRAGGVTRGTTQISIADDEGNLAAVTLSNGEASGVVVPGAGVMLNNMLGEEDLHREGFGAARPGKRLSSGMAPSILLDRDDRPVAAFGSGGSERIQTAIVQFLHHHCAAGRSLSEAVEAPRVHWDGRTLHAEPGLPEPVLAALSAAHEVRPWRVRSMFFGGVHGVAVDGPTGVPVAAHGDTRRGGAGRLVRSRSQARS